MVEFIRWLALSIILPLAPICIRSFMSMLGTVDINIFEVPELLFYSIITCTVALNVFEGEKQGFFISLLNLFLYAIIGLNLVLFSMFYNNNANDKCLEYSIIVSIIPTFIAIGYKIKAMQSAHKLGSFSNTSIEKEVS